MTSRSRPPDRWLSLIPDLDTLDPDHPSVGAPYGRPRTEHGAPEDGAPEVRDDTPQSTPAEAGQRTQTPPGLLPLYTPAEAATLLAVRESWLRRRAAARTIACTFLGKHLRFSPADLHAIITANAHQPSAHACRPTSMRRRNARTAPPPRAPHQQRPTRAGLAADEPVVRRRAPATRATRAPLDGQEMTSWRG